LLEKARQAIRSSVIRVSLSDDDLGELGASVVAGDAAGEGHRMGLSA